jgi:hypothetical protein
LVGQVLPGIKINGVVVGLNIENTVVENNLLAGLLALNVIYF